MTNLTDELPQLIISALFILLLGALLITRVITPDNPIFIGGSGSILLLIASYWLGNGLVRLSHTQTMKAVGQMQIAPPVQSFAPILDHTTQPMLAAVPAPAHEEGTQPAAIQTDIPQ